MLRKLVRCCVRLRRCCFSRRTPTLSRQTAEGTVTYLKAFERLSADEKRVIRKLQLSGFSFTVNEENPKAAANIDLTMCKALWEIKSSKCETFFAVSANLGDAAWKWRRLGDASPVRVVFENTGEVSETVVIKQIKKLMPHIQYKPEKSDKVMIFTVDEVLYIGKSGKIRWLGK
ncbi:MAG: hypothetical protein FWG00_02470 [Coriobacteriia bacterium]|nr:hypothetical protein [Coriobacteriia bacterium]